MAAFLVFVGVFIAQHAWSTLLEDKGAYLERPFGYSGPVFALCIGIGAVIAGGYCFIDWASI
jgi:hypothetical protein